MFGKNQIIQNLVAYLRYQNLYAIKEKCQHGSIQVPYSYYDCGIPDYFTSVPLHWHSEMELNYIWKWFFQIRGSDHLCQTGRHLSDPAQRPSCYHVG